MYTYNPLLSLPTEILIAEGPQPPLQPLLLRPGGRPLHPLLPPLHEEGVQAGEGELHHHQEGDLASLGLGAGQGDVASIVQTHLFLAIISGFQNKKN